VTAVDATMNEQSPERPTGRYGLLQDSLSASALEETLLARWQAEDLFHQTLRARERAPEFVFYEGPPTANGRPGIHHVFARTVKDLFCRHRAMRGFHVTRKAGWDTHGLPVEIEVEKQLGISGKQQIEEYGVERFNRLSRESVWRYRGDWERLSERIGYWLDYANPYVTYSNEYVESVWWALKTLYERDYLYRGHKILPYCPRCGTALSSHEVAQGYEDVEDPSVYVALDLVEEREGGGSSASSPPSSRRRRILVWTTTPWTLVSNVALAVHPDLEYVELRKKTGADFTLILADARVPAVFGGDWADRWDVVGRMRGAELAGGGYRRPLDWVSLDSGAHEVIVAESFVSADDGSGVVHMAPAFGADDYAVGRRHGLAFVQPVNARGEFPQEMPIVGGKFVKDADALIVEELRRRDVLWKAGTMEHAYPHCWRCGTPLLYYARSSWFVRTTAFKDAMLARNARVNWNPPEVGEGRFGEWLKNNIDWAVSRDRYWGTPLPVWVNEEDPDEIEVIGSYAELAERVGRLLPAGFDPHKPYVDQYSWPAKSGRGTMRRVPEVIDAWFDSGSMPFAQWHYPFENRDVVARHYPGDFIAEGVDQTRGWFYSLLAIATGLGEELPNNGAPSPPSAQRPQSPVASRQAETREGGGDWGSATGGARREAISDSGGQVAAPYRSVVVNDLVLDASGQKMSKSRGNAVDPWEVIGRHGVDAVRLFLIASSQIWVPRRFDEAAIRETAGSFLRQLRNVYSGMFAQYANFGWAPSELDPPVAARPPIDRWVLSRLATVEREVDALLGRFEATAAARTLMSFTVDEVCNWYVRLNRRRFYDVDTADNRAAFATLHEVLVVICRLLAPFAPFLSDWMHRELTGTSVHLAPFLRGSEGALADVVDAELEGAMAQVRALVTLGRAARDEAGIGVRQPLPRMVCVVPRSFENAMAPLVPLLAAELNVKHVEFAGSADALVTLEAKPNFRSLGKKFGKSTPLAAQAVAALGGEALRAFEQGTPLAVAVGNESHEIDADDLTILRRASGDLVVKEEGGYFAALDPTLTPELRREALAREVVSRVQQLRKTAKLEVSDRIRLWVAGNVDLETAVREYRGWVADEVLARDVAVGETPEEYHAMQTVDIDGLTATIALSKDQ
jgi:isoleucyl-tRNA synthetase